MKQDLEQRKYANLALQAELTLKLNNASCPTLSRLAGCCSHSFIYLMYFEMQICIISASRPSSDLSLSYLITKNSLSIRESGYSAIRDSSKRKRAFKNSIWENEYCTYLFQTLFYSFIMKILGHGNSRTENDCATLTKGVYPMLYINT